MRARPCIAAVAAALTLTSCGGGDRAERPATTTTAPAAAGPELVSSCPGVGRGWRTVAVRAHGADLDAERSVGAPPEILPGVDQLSDSNGPRVRAAIVAFLRANAR